MTRSETPRLRWLELLAAACALAGPVLIAMGTAFVSGRGTRLPLPLLALLGFGPTLAGLGVLTILKRRLAFLGLAELAGLGWFLAGFAAGAPPPTAAYAFALPPARPPARMSIQHIVTGVIHRTASFAYRGGGFGDPRTFTMNALLLQHPAGDLLIDAGFGANVEEHLAQMPLGFRLITKVERRRSAREALASAGYPLDRLHAIVLTHAHWDHASGAGELAPVPVWLPKAERDFVRSGWITAVARSIQPSRFQTYDFPNGPYLHFARSRDVFGDGSVVLVPAPGHTPGSVIVFVARPDGRRLALLGDLAWQLEGVLERSERPWLTRLGDHEPGAVRDELARMAALRARYPQLELVPAHDPRGYEHIPELSQERSGSL